MKDTPNTYAVDVNGFSGSFTVKDDVLQTAVPLPSPLTAPNLPQSKEVSAQPEPSPSLPLTAPESSSPTELNHSLLIGGIITAILIAGLVVYRLRINRPGK